MLLSVIIRYEAIGAVFPGTAICAQALFVNVACFPLLLGGACYKHFVVDKIFPVTMILQHSRAVDIFGVNGCHHKGRHPAFQYIVIQGLYPTGLCCTGNSKAHKMKSYGQILVFVVLALPGHNLLNKL
jgi:hypothetical protein